MSETITLRVKNKEAKSLIENLDALNVIEIVEDKIPSHWVPKKKQHARDFLAAYKEAKLAEEGKLELKTVDELIAELQDTSFTKKESNKKDHSNKLAKK